MVTNKINSGAGASLLGLILLTASSVSAQVVSFNFTGSLSSVSDQATYLPDDIQSGQSFTGTITYDTAHVSDSDASSNGQYIFTGAAQGDFSMTVNVSAPGHVYSFTSVAVPPIVQNSVQVQTAFQIDYTVGDALMDGAPLPAVSNGSRLILSLSDVSGSALSNDALPTSAPAFSDFVNHRLFFEGQETGGFTVYGFEGTIDSITPVPEPATAAACAGFGLLVFAVWRRGFRQRW
jgi:hypothetical protein